MIPFPDDRSFERSEDGSEPKLGGSVGLNRILLRFRNQSVTDQAPSWGLYLINAATVLRNVHSTWKPDFQYKTLSDELAVKLFQQDISLYITYLTAYLSRFVDESARFPVVIYYPEYKDLGKYARTFKGKTEEFWNQYKRIVNAHIKFEPTKTLDQSYCEVWEMRLGRHTYPHLELYKWIQKFVLGEGVHAAYRWGHSSVLLLSHCAIDLHLRLQNLVLIESHTAALKPPNLFYTKLNNLPSGTVVPFNRFTHQLFGDSSLLMPMATGKNKTKLLELSATHRWGMSGTNVILEDAARVAAISPSDYLSI